MMPPQIVNEDCAFCLERRSGYLEDAALNMFKAPRIKRVVDENGDLFVVPSLGPLTFGHLLLVSNEHIESLRDASPDFAQRAIEAALGARDVLQKITQSEILIFENGEKFAASEGSCISHVHIHLIPLSRSVRSAAFTEANGFTRVKTRLSEYVTQLPRAQDYSVIIDDLDNGYSLVKDSIPSQYMRKVVSNLVGIPEKWNWRDYHEIQKIGEMVEALAAHRFLP